MPPADIHRVAFRDHPELHDFARLARLEAARITAEGKPADAWTWHRAALRSSAHVARYSQLLGRFSGFAIYARTADFVRGWAARPNLSANDLRQALADTIAVNEMTPLVSEALKCDYLGWRTKEDRSGVIDAAVPNFGQLLEQLKYDERARRTLNLTYANLLSQAHRPRFRRTPIRGSLNLFGSGPQFPVTPKVYSDEEIEGKILTFPPDVKLARSFLPPKNLFDVFDNDHVEQAALVLGLALQLHYREHSQFPSALTELVKNGYLKSIPPDLSGKGEPFRYRRENDLRQGAVLWSVWLDGIDQEGKLDVWKSTQEGKGDRIVKIDAPR
jgi:hypothetical protein